MPEEKNRSLRQRIRTNILHRYLEEKIKTQARITERTFAESSRNEAPNNNLFARNDTEERRKFAKKIYKEVRAEEIEKINTEKREEEYRKLTEGRKKITFAEYQQRRNKQ